MTNPYDDFGKPVKTTLEEEKPGYNVDYKTADPNWFEQPKLTSKVAATPRVGWKKLNPEAQLPEYKTAGASGMDIKSVEDVVIQPGKTAVVDTGLAVVLPEGYEAQVRSRSGLAVKGVVVANSPGTIDNDYAGPVKVILINHSSEPFVVSKGDRVAQIVISAYVQSINVLVEQVKDTERGSGGFGSTGMR